MLTITIPASESIELWDEAKEEFIYTKARREQTLQLEHSLVSISKWESKWKKPFIGKNDKTFDEIIDYIRCMTLTRNVDPEIYNGLTADNIKEIDEYINDPMTATTFSASRKNGPSREIITSEIIYYSMITFNIPIEFQKWHLNRLLTLIKVCDVKNQPSKKLSQKELMSRNTALNAARRKQLNTKG